MKLRNAVVLLAVLLGLSGGAARPQKIKIDDSYIFCVIPDTVNSVLYVSAVFLGNTSRNGMYGSEFRTHLRMYYPRLYGYPECMFAESRSEGEQRKRSWLARKRPLFHSVVDTRWSY